MKLSKFVGKRLKEAPKDAVMPSHVFLVRGAYVKQLAAGIYSMLPLGHRVKSKIENIIRNEMNKIEGQEVSMPVIHPADIWKETNRYFDIGDELLRFKDRTGKEHVLAMTHEEASVHLVKNNVSSYKQLPFMIYQIQTKFRDEARSRGGLIRVREFTMKDAYSFHETNEDLERYYNIVHESYMRIFKKSGLNNFISVESDTGIMGGGKAHEFMALNDAGEDTLFICPKCGYKANKEIAQSIIENYPEEEKQLEKVETPDKKTIEEVADFLNLPKRKILKTVIYKLETQLVFAIIRGDLDINETKLKKILKSKDLKFATDDEIMSVGAVPGFASPLNLDKDVIIIADNSVVSSNNLVCGANEMNYHYKNFNLKRDLNESKYIVADIYSVKEHDKCINCGNELDLKRGIEIGNIFQLGTKYSKPMHATFLDKSGKEQYFIMASYGIGVGRLMATIIEEHHDKFGPIWPITVAPFEVHLNGLNLKKGDTKEKCDTLYNEMLQNGIDVIYDDRDERPGVQFNDADLIGVPFRIIVSPKTLSEDEVEFKKRGEKDSIRLSFDQVIPFLKEKIEAEYKKYE